MNALQRIEKARFAASKRWENHVKKSETIYDLANKVRNNPQDIMLLKQAMPESIYVYKNKKNRKVQPKNPRGTHIQVFISMTLDDYEELRSVCGEKYGALSKWVNFCIKEGIKKLTLR